MAKKKNESGLPPEEIERLNYGREYGRYISESIGEEFDDGGCAGCVAFRCDAVVTSGGDKRKRNRICPHASERECCAYCPNVQYREKLNKLCSEIISCADLFYGISVENMRLKEQLELERWRLGQLKKIFEGKGKNDLYKAVMSYADDYCVEAENKRLKKLRRDKRKQDKRTGTICSALAAETLPESPELSDEQVLYTFIDADGNEQTVMTTKKIAEGLAELDERQRRANDRENAHIAEFGKDPFTSDMQRWTERKIGSIYGYAQIGDESRKRINEAREAYAERFNRHWKEIVRRAIHADVANANMADSYYYSTFENMSNAEIASKLGIADSLVSRYIKKMQLFAEEMNYDHIFLFSGLRASYDKTIAKFRRMYEDT